MFKFLSKLVRRRKPVLNERMLLHERARLYAVMVNANMRQPGCAAVDELAGMIDDIDQALAEHSTGALSSLADRIESNVKDNLARLKTNALFDGNVWFDPVWPVPTQAGEDES